jgi:GMP reductase
LPLPIAQQKWTGFPLIASNMDATGTMRMAKALATQDAMTALSKYHAPKEIEKFFRARETDNSFYSMGITITTDDLEKLRKLNAMVSISKISIEAANGYIPAARQNNGFICSDGGCTVVGDICKALAPEQTS